MTEHTETIAAPKNISAPVAHGADPETAQILTVLYSIRPLRADGAAYDQDAKLGAVGFTSLEMVNVMLGVEAAFDVMIPASDITAANFASATAIVAMIKRIR